jgi:hypothetical protein
MNYPRNIYIKKHFIFVALFLACASVSLAQNNQKIKVFILAGQSNMDGRGNADLLTKKEQRALAFAQERIQFFYKGTVNNMKEMVVIDGPLDVTDPWEFVKKKFRLNKCFGPELFFGIELSKAYPNQDFLFIKRSQGGTSLYGAWNPDWHFEKAQITKEENKRKLFRDLISTIDQRLNNLPPDSYELAGMLWVQGESDSNTKFSTLPSDTYGQNIVRLIQKVREHYNVPEMPFLMLEVGSKKVVDGMRKASKKLNFVSLVNRSKNPKANNFTPIYSHYWNGKPAGHYNYDGMKKIGQLFFESYQSSYANNLK